MSEPIRYRRVIEEIRCDQFIPRVSELEAQGGSFWVIKVLKHSSGYGVQCDVPIADQPSQDRELELPLQ